MGEEARRVQQVADDARSGDDLVRSEMAAMVWQDDMLVPELDSPLDAETLDEQASTQMGPWESRRRDAE
jgi:hypothetical protein